MTAAQEEHRWLAAEYALGVLQGERLQQARRRYAMEPVFRTDVDAWQEQLAPLQEDVQPVEPPDSVWRQIEQRVFERVTAPAPTLAEKLSFWRALSAATTAFAVVILLVLLVTPESALRPPASAPATLVASLNSSAGKAMFVATLDVKRLEMRVRRLPVAAHAADQVPELWVIPADGRPRSLGVIQGAAGARIAVDPAMQKLFQDGVVLAISLEPQGGSPTGSPTGPIPWTGALYQL